MSALGSSRCLPRLAGRWPAPGSRRPVPCPGRRPQLRCRSAADELTDAASEAVSAAAAQQPAELAALQHALDRALGASALFLADASVASVALSAGGADPGAAPAVQRAGGWVAPLADALEQTLYFLRDGLDKLHVPYSYGYSIILLTLIVKIVTYPLTKQQVESTMAVQALKPRIDLIRDRYGDDKDKIQKETSVLYEQAGVNPLAGCLPTLATIPIFIGLFSSLTNVANDGLLDTAGFYGIPSLAGPTTMAQRQSGLGTSWLYPFVDGAPPLGWDTALAYLTLPVLLVAVQYASAAVTSPPIDPKDENANTQRALMVGLPLMIGWFALNLPSGLSLYYLSNTVLTAAQQIYLKKLGGARVVLKELGPVTKPGSGRRAGIAAAAFAPWTPLTVVTTAEAAKAAADKEAAAERAREAAEAAYDEAAASGMSFAGSVDEPGPAAAAAAAAAVPAIDPATVSRRCRRRRLTSLVQDGSAMSAAAAGVAPAEAPLVAAQASA